MAITPLTGFKSFTFGDVVSTDYGVQILGEGVFNAPERVVEMIEIPGRNGKFALDMGRFENIEVTYPATLIADNVTDFAEALSDLRNALCSKRGYMRLEDDYHPDEYRMAVYKEGLEVDEEVLRVGKFKITFDCKPQRFLTSGETAVSVDSGDTLTNPTLFEASPMLDVEGYGTLVVNGHEIVLNDQDVGEVVLLDSTTNAVGHRDIAPSLMGLVDIGDTITLGETSLTVKLTPRSWVSTFSKFEITSASFPSGHNIANYVSYSIDNSNPRYPAITFNYGEQTFTRTGSDPIQKLEDAITLSLKLTKTDSSTSTGTLTASIRLQFRNHDSFGYYWLNVDLAPGYSTSGNITSYIGQVGASGKWSSSELIADSTQSVLGHPTYIDCDLGEAYKLEDGVPVSLNAYIDLGSKLPILSVGSSEITFDNTITDLKVTPRWWKI